MTDHNKVRDEVCDNPEFNIGDTKMDALLLHNRKFGWNECVTHLSKQSVAFDECDAKRFWTHEGLDKWRNESEICMHGAKKQHQQTALIYEAKLSVAVEMLKELLKWELEDHVHETIYNVLEKLGAK